ncbi:MAG TPA: TIGR00730 family Rossman fold protein [Verrucomicrobiae bacterium]|nr:TIGR00730 family Rossman fold protein [Verrucomicrobiae bacterium]
MTSICVYCGSSPGKDPSFAQAARELGALLAKRGHTLVYGGGNVGLMGVVADAVLAAGGRVVGVIPDNLVRREVGHTGLTEQHVVTSMHDRKAKMAALGDGFLALPGGVGTLEEIVEVFVWMQLGLHGKPCALLNVNGYYDPLVKYLEHMVESRFLWPEQLSQLIVAREPAEALDRMASFVPKSMEKWLDRKAIPIPEA